MIRKLLIRWIYGKPDPDYKATHHIEVHFTHSTTLQGIQSMIDELMECDCVEEVGYFDAE